MKKLNILALVSIFFLPSAQASEQDCREIRDAEKRLACFDKQFVSEPDSAVSGAPNTKSEPVTPVERPRSPGNQMKSLFDWEGAEPFIGTIKKIRSREKQRMVFLLENDQVWIQTEPRPQPFQEGEQVSIKTGLMGGFNMRSKSGAYTRVRRIQ